MLKNAELHDVPFYYKSIDFEELVREYPAGPRLLSRCFHAQRGGDSRTPGAAAEGSGVAGLQGAFLPEASGKRPALNPAISRPSKTSRRRRCTRWKTSAKVWTPTHPSATTWGRTCGPVKCPGASTPAGAPPASRGLPSTLPGTGKWATSCGRAPITGMASSRATW